MWVDVKQIVPFPFLQMYGLGKNIFQTSLDQVADFMSEGKVGFLKTQSNSDTSLAARTYFRQKG